MVDKEYMRRVAKEEQEAQQRMRPQGIRKSPPYATPGTWGWEANNRKTNPTKPDKDTGIGQKGQQ